ncbi:MAG TPA: TonB-dependent receptor [Burkholderiaceae bacterium]|nr:TonB-dependent receptor [Burkholderiaceae bacterium]
MLNNVVPHRRSAPMRVAARSASLCLFAASAHAQVTSPTELETVVVTATRSEQQLSDTLPHTTVITRADIDRSQMHDLLELLGQQAGVEVARAGGFGAQASIFMRGTNSSQTLVVTDGIRLNTAVGGAATLGGISLDTVERIEIVRGNLSSVYGSEAIGGVIQIFTRGGGKPGASASGEVGADDSRIATVAANTKLGTTEFAIAGGYRYAKPFSAIDTTHVIPGPFAPGANPDLDANRNRTGSLRIRQPLGDRVELGASAWTTRNDTDFDSTSDGPTATHHEKADQDAWQVIARVAATEQWTTRLQAGEVRDNSRDTSSNPSSFNNGEFQARNRQITWNNTFALLPTLDAFLGAEQVQQHGASTSYDVNFANTLVSFDRRVRAVWTGASLHGETHHLQLNLRNDDYSDVGSATTGLAAYGYQITPSWRVSVQYSTAFRAPSFNDLYFPGFGNPNLAPERARSIEGGVRYAQGDTSVRLVAYRTKTHDLIVFDQASGIAQNIASTRIDGAEVVLATRAADWRVVLNFDASSPIDEATDQRLLRRAPYRVTLDLARTFGTVDLGASVTHVAARYDSDINTSARTRLAPYTLLRATLAYRVNKYVRLTLRVENLTDEQYELVSGYNTQRRGGFAGIEVRT